MNELSRPTPEALLKAAKKESRGRLKIFLGAAPGVGKTYEMLREGAEMLGGGTDVVIGYVETHGRPETDALVAPFEVIPRNAVSMALKSLKNSTSTRCSRATPPLHWSMNSRTRMSPAAATRNAGRT